MRRRRRPPFDALAPVGPREQRRQAILDERASVRALSGIINRGANASAQNIAGVYGRLAGDLGQYRATEQGIYDRARANLGADNAAAASQVGQAAGNVGAALNQNLALSGPTGVDASGYGGDVSRIQTGQQTRGQGNIGELALRQAAAENYAAQLPQFARLAGGQALQQSEAGRRRDLADLSAKGAAQLAQSLATRHNLEYQKAVAARGFGVDYAKLQTQARIASAAERGRNARNTASNQSREGIAAANRRAQKARAILAEGGKNSRARAAAVKQGRSVDVNHSQQAGVLYDKNGKIIRWKHGKGKGKPIPWHEGRHKGTGKKGSSSGGKLQ